MKVCGWLAASNLLLLLKGGLFMEKLAKALGVDQDELKISIRKVADKIVIKEDLAAYKKEHKKSKQ